MHITVGGLVADIHDGYKVLDKDGAPIEGLRAVGETIVGSCGIGVMGRGPCCRESAVCIGPSRCNNLINRR